ncbi:MAG TPA: hypothetical protein VHS28_01145, partial [Chloroflexota bacterium]|nr:hypothetical protein [Chloroflexota bacterium]
RNHLLVVGTLWEAGPQAGRCARSRPVPYEPSQVASAGYCDDLGSCEAERSRTGSLSSGGDPSSLKTAGEREALLLDRK